MSTFSVNKMYPYIITILIIAFAIIFVIFVRREPEVHDNFNEDIKILESTIDSLKKDIMVYEKQIQSLEEERNELKALLSKLSDKHEKVDTELSNGDWDTNIRYLSEFLSKKDSVGK